MSPDIRSLVGQSLMFRFEGPEFTPADREAFNHVRPGGVLFFGDNLASHGQVKALTAELQQAAREEGLPPLFIAADQEGGIVTRFPVDMITVPSAMALGPLDEETIRESARITGKQLLEVGINTNYAPAVDININPQNPVIRTRSFGETPEMVARAGVATMRGFQDEGVIPTVKHFPGHGNTSIDSHYGLPIIDATLEELHEVELVPFKAAIAAGVPMIMTAHILFPALDTEYPATLSERILTGFLRNELGFTGVIVTDSMSMHAISKRYGDGEAAILAKQAGVDVLETSEPPAATVGRSDALVTAVESGRLPVSLFEQTAGRLDTLRHEFSIGEVKPDPVDLSALRNAAQRVANRTIRTLGGSTLKSVPNASSTVVIAFARLRALEVVDRFDLPLVMEQAFADELPNANVITLSPNPSDSEIEKALAAASHATTLILCTRDAISHADQVETGRRIRAAASPTARTVHVCLRGPYDTGLLGDFDETVYTYGDAVVSLRALANTFAGRA